MSSGDEKLKSALDIALEKAKRLGNLSYADKQRLKEEKLAVAAEALGKRYLEGLPLRDLEIELGKREEDRRIVIRYLLSFLVSKINLKNPEEAKKILVAIQHFSTAPSAAENIRNLLNEYRSAVEQAWQENHVALRKAKKKELTLKGISGSAVVPEITISSEWLQIQQRLDSEYQKRLEWIKTHHYEALTDNKAP